MPQEPLPSLPAPHPLRHQPGIQSPYYSCSQRCPGSRQVLLSIPCWPHIPWGCPAPPQAGASLDCSPHSGCRWTSKSSSGPNFLAGLEFPQAPLGPGLGGTRAGGTRVESPGGCVQGLPLRACALLRPPGEQQLPPFLSPLPVLRASSPRPNVCTGGGGGGLDAQMEAKSLCNLHLESVWPVQVNRGAVPLPDLTTKPPLQYLRGLLREGQAGPGDSLPQVNPPTKPRVP